MSHPPFEHAESLVIGTVDFVAPDEIKVSLDIEAPESVALNTGSPRPFPRVNGYVLVPVDDGYLVGQIEWLTVERSPFPKRRGLQDFGLVDLPYPLRKMSVNPLGTLRARYVSGGGFVFTRGTEALPSIGTTVMLPTDEQLRSIVESGERRRIKIGTSPLAGNADVCVDPDRLFGRHLAVLGNTGSGKSCSVAGLIRWSLEQAQAAAGAAPNARFIVLDPNGEYARAFTECGSSIGARIFSVQPAEGEVPLHVPLWFWNSEEWCAFTQASSRAQRPTLIQALRLVREGVSGPDDSPDQELRRYLRAVLATAHAEKASGGPWGEFPKPKAFRERIEKWKASLEPMLSELDNEQRDCVAELVALIERLLTPRQVQYADQNFTLQEVNSLIDALRTAYLAVGGTDRELSPLDADVPRRFTGESFLRCVEATADMLNTMTYTETLLIRVRTLLADGRMQPVLCDDEAVSLSEWLDDYVGADQGSNGGVCVVDLSLVPSEVVHIEASVIARMVFEALQRYRHRHGSTLPTVLVMEEAHTFVRRYRDDVEGYDSAALCCRVFERIAREGRKFGLGLVLSSQRPSELSPTVLSQCNSFLLHRISNDRDQDLVQRFVPDYLRGLLRELPSLPSQNAILLGWASELPVLVRMNDLPKSQQPHSDDPDFWNVWTRKDEHGQSVKREVDWQAIADEWQRITSAPEESPS